MAHPHETDQYSAIHTYIEFNPRLTLSNRYRLTTNIFHVFTDTVGKKERTSTYVCKYADTYFRDLRPVPETITLSECSPVSLSLPPISARALTECLPRMLILGSCP
jgi:hypothetical protein